MFLRELSIWIFKQPNYKRCFNEVQNLQGCLLAIKAYHWQENTGMPARAWSPSLPLTRLLSLRYEVPKDFPRGSGGTNRDFLLGMKPAKAVSRTNVCPSNPRGKELPAALACTLLLYVAVVSMLSHGHVGDAEKHYRPSAKVEIEFTFKKYI